MHIFIIFIGLIFLGVPVVAGLIITATVGLSLTEGISLVVVAQRISSALDGKVLHAIPLFVLTGNLMLEGGVSKRLFRLAKVLVGHMRGGLAQVNMVLSVFDGGLSGSSAADAAICSKVVVPEMIKGGYPMAFSSAITAAGGILSNVIPPSIAMLVYASLTGASVGKLFIAGFIPGLMLALSMSITAYVICRKNGYGEKTKRASIAKILYEFWKSGTALLIPIIIVIGIRIGFFTATEGGAITAFIAFILGLFVYKDLKLRNLPRVLAQTAVDSGIVLLIIAFASPIAWVVGFNEIPQQIAAYFASLSGNRIIFLLLVNILLLIGGTLLEGVSLLILVVPIVTPIAVALGIDPVHFGMIVVVNVVIGAITPPFGQVVFFVSSFTRDKVENIFKHLIPYYPFLLIVLILVTYFPEIYMWTVPLFGP